MLSKIWVWYPGSGIRDPEKTYSGSGIPGSKRHRIQDPGSGSATLQFSVPFSQSPLPPPPPMINFVDVTTTKYKTVDW
jgi:hypothetical protein